MAKHPAWASWGWRKYRRKSDRRVFWAIRVPHDCDFCIGPGPQTVILRVKAGDYAIYPGRQIQSGDPPITTTTTTHADIEANYTALLPQEVESSTDLSEPERIGDDETALRMGV
jgi:hypothetical protein